MAEIERAFKKSYFICKEHPAIFLPYLIKEILKFFLLILLAFSVLLTLGIDVSSASSFNLENEKELSLFLLHLKSALTHGSIFFILFGIAAVALLWIAVDSAGEGATINYAKQIIKNEKPSVFEGARKYAFPLAGYALFISLLNALAVLVFLLLIFLFYLLVPGIALFFSFFMVFLLIIVLIVLNIGAIFSRQFIAGRERGIVSGFRESVGFVFSNLFSVFIYIIAAVFIIGAFALGTSIASFLSELVFSFAPFLSAFASFAIFIFSFLIGAAISTYLETVKTALVLEGEAGERKVEA